MAGKHRKVCPSTTKKIMAAATGAGALTLATGALAVPTASAHDWSGVAACESSGDWQVNTGNGFYGGLQFLQSTWDAFKPAGAPERADLASVSDQIAAAEATLLAQGIGAWPVCGAYLGWGGVTPGLEAPAPEPAPVPQSCSWAQPVTGTKSQDFHGGHDGVDVAAGMGTPVYAAADGVIDVAGIGNDPGGYGNYVQQQAENGATIQYGHVSEVYVSAGDYANAGDLIAAVGSAGQSTGPHLHLRIHDGGAVDPEAYLVNQGVALDWSGPSGCAAPVPAPAPAPEAGAPDTVMVVPGDTLSHIAAVFGTDWQTLYELNADVIPDPDLIYPGQVLRLP